MIEIYLLNIQELESEKRQQQVRYLLDDVRLEKADRYQNRKEKARSLGAGLLLQYLFQTGKGQGKGLDKTKEDRKDIENIGNVKNMKKRKPLLCYITLEEICSSLLKGVPLLYRYGKGGKPYWKEGPFFSLSHSGDYAGCVVAGQEVGMDLQQVVSTANIERMAKRFFTQEEQKKIEQCSIEDRQELFFRLWVKKEALGKLSGYGLKDGLRSCVLENRLSGEWQGVCFAEYCLKSNYYMAVCWNEKEKERIYMQG